MAGIVNLRATKHFKSTDHERKWLLVDAEGQSVGRLASRIAMILRGKHKPTYTTHDDVGDFVVVINADKVQLRGNDKVNKKMYFKWTGWRGNMKRRNAATMLELAPHKVLELAVGGMLPRGSLGSHQLKKLKIYRGAEHPHKAQKPEPFKVEV
jgi:large subunit ribosomal protein L13